MDVEKLFKQRQDARVSLIQESINDINFMITERAGLHNEILSSLDKLDMFISDSMPKTSITSGDAMAKQQLIRELLKKKIELGELRAEEKLNFWRDTAMLKRELREHMKEFRDLQSKTDMMDNLLEM